MNLKQLLFIGWIIGFGALSVQAQQGNNPFEIAGSTAADSMEQTELLQGDNPFLLNNQESATSNPFELSSPAKTQGVGGREDFRPEQAIENRPGLNFQFLFFSGLLIFLAVLITLYRSVLTTFYKAFLNDNMLKLLHRQRPFWKASTLLPYAFFFLNLGVFAALWVTHNQSAQSGMAGLTFKLVGFAILLVVCKHLILSFLGSIFPVKKECNLYNFTIIVFSITLGLILVPLNLLLAFGPDFLKPNLFYLTALVMILVLLFRSLRAIFQSSRLIVGNKFHFFLYLCTIEIAPVFVLLKWITY